MNVTGGQTVDHVAVVLGGLDSLHDGRFGERSRTLVESGATALTESWANCAAAALK